MKSGKSAIDLCEEAVHLLRRTPVSTYVFYYVGTLPFLLGLLFFWTEMSESSLARDHVAAESFGVAMLYVWMAVWQAQFARCLHAQLAMQPPPPLTWRIAAAQAALQPTKLIVLPAASLAALPFGRAFALYHSASVTDSFREARLQSSYWPKQNWTFLSLLAILAIVVFVNVAMALVGIPYLAKTLLGIDSVFTRSASGFLNTTFLIVALGLSYAVLNPFVKAVYVLRCFYGESLTTAQDLRAALKTASTAALLLLASFSVQAQPAPAQLDQSIDRVLEKPEYTWRLPRKPEQPDDRNRHSWFVRTTLDFLDYMGQSFKSLGKWLDKWWTKLGNLFGKHKLPEVHVPDAAPPAQNLRLLMVALLAVAVGIVVFLGWQALARRRQAASAVADMPAPPVIDLTSEDLQADQQPLDEWLNLAQQCIERNELRLALRALYLAGLSSLAAESLIALQRSKSDRDYARELQRRARNRPDLVAAFSGTLQQFERGWYGMYEVDLPQLDQVRGHLDRMRPSAQ